MAVIGAPNAGKSSLLNALVGRDAAIVTATPGTTRDVIEAPLTVAGYRVIVADTAGRARASDDPIEGEGVRRAARLGRGRGLTIVCRGRVGQRSVLADAGRPSPGPAISA